MTTNNATNNFSSSPLTTKGDLYGFDTGNNRLPVGSNYYFVQADSSQAIGLSYQLPIKADEVVSYQLIDFYGSLNGDGAANTQTSGTGSSAATVDTLDNTRAGLIKLDMGTTTTGYANVAQSGGRKNIILGASSVILETCINLNTLSNGTDTYTFMFGTVDQQVTTSPANGVWIGYSSAVNSGNWTINAIKASGATSTFNTASGPSAATWYKLRLVITNTATAQAYVGVAGSDFTSLGTLSASLPTAAMTIWVAQLIKSAGTTDTFGYVDYVSSKAIYNSLR